MDIAAGAVIDQWQLDVRLGGGAFGSVWRARDVRNGDVVAIKLLTGILAADERGDIRREIEVLAGMASTRSAHVVRVLGGGAEPVPHIVMEYVDGSDLAARLHEHGALDAAETIEVGYAIASALAVLKDAGIIHRDVKPANVLIGSDGVARLADFGIAKIVGFETITMTGQLPMTMAYAAPEVWDGHATHQSDLYAMGVLLFQCLAGEPPFTGSYSSLFKQHTTVTPNLAALPADIPSHLRALIRGCLQKDAAARPPDAAACVAILETARRELADPASVAAATDLIAFGVASVDDGDGERIEGGDTTMIAVPFPREATVMDAAPFITLPAGSDGAVPPPSRTNYGNSKGRNSPFDWRLAGIAAASVIAAAVAATAALFVFDGGSDPVNPDTVIAGNDTVKAATGDARTPGAAQTSTTATPHETAVAPDASGGTKTDTTTASGPLARNDDRLQSPTPPSGTTGLDPGPPATGDGGAAATAVTSGFTGATDPRGTEGPSFAAATSTWTPTPTATSTRPPTPTFTFTPTVPPPPPPPPAASLVIIDDNDSSFSRGTAGLLCPSAGTENRAYNWCWANAVKDGVPPYAGHYWYTWNNSGSNDENWGKWVPNLTAAGTYRVCAYIPPDHAYSHAAKYQIHRNGGVSVVTLNQQSYAAWKDLGTFDFPAGSGGYVYLGDATGEAWATTMVGYDAMKWVPNGGGC